MKNAISTTQKRASIRQVAEFAGVSPMTVSNVLRNPDVVIEPTRERVLAAVRELEYVPIRASVQNRHSQTHIISVVFEHEVTNRYAYQSPMFEGLRDGAASHGYDLLVLLRDEQEWARNREEARFLDRRSDGVIFVSARLNRWHAALESLVCHGIPAVQCYQRDVPRGAAWVDSDNISAINLAVKHLFSRGHQKILHIANRGEFADAKERKTAFVQALKKRGARDAAHRVLQVQWKPPGEPGLGAELMQRVLESGATAAICDDDIALELKNSLEQNGKKVPRDFSIVGVNNVPRAELFGLTTIEIPFYEIGRAAIESWIKLQSGAAGEDCSKLLPVSLIERKSVAAPRSSGAGIY